MWRRLPLLLPTALLLAGCGAAGSLTTPGNDETDRVAQVVSDAIAWPRQDTAMGFARAASDTTAAQDGRLTVVEVSELEAAELTEPFAELMFLVHLDGSSAGLIETDPVTACYRAQFGFYGVVESPRRTDCPEDATAADLPPAPTPGPRPEIPENADRVLRGELRRLPDSPEAAPLETDLVAALRAEPGTQPPAVEVALDGADVGVSLRGEDGCLLGARVAGEVEVWRPSAVQLQPGELTCDPSTALAALGQTAPH